MWAIGCVLYEMAALRRAFEAPTLPALILKIMRDVTSPLPAQYSPGARQLLANLLALEPSKRPSIPEIMSHHWLAPYIFRQLATATPFILSLTSIFRIPTTVGLIPCTATQNRPVTIEAAQVKGGTDGLILTLLNIFQPDSKFTRRGSPSQYTLQHRTTATFRWDASASSAPVTMTALDPRSEIVAVAMSESITSAVESSGAVFRWEEGGGRKHLPGLNGINIVNIAVGDKVMIQN